jgi:hypothetical protein
LSSHEDSASSEYGGIGKHSYGQNPRSDFFRPEPNVRKGERYSSISYQRSEGELGATESADEISLGEIRMPGKSFGVNKPYQSRIGGVPGIPKMGERPPTGGIRPELAETINYEEDKFSPEKEEEKPIYESSEGPIPKIRGNGRGKPSTATVGKSGTNVLNSNESFGMNAMKSGGLGGRIQSSHGYLRDTIKDDFLNEDDEDEEMPSIRESAESGELYNPNFGVKRR